MADPRIVVHPPSPEGGRRVHVDAAPVGVAYGVADLLEFLRRAGLDPDDVRLNDPMIKWRGGGPQVWGVLPADDTDA
ncbi:hypothetical protein WKI65_22030 [Streptomyces sp. MS1.AVA.3]|uniref:hypothetical protein n=1 Tax=Streptomyces decoyicus TaxID=249567 RepID=UPI0030C0D660